MGDAGKIIDGTYNVTWVIYTISGNTYQLFPIQYLVTHVMGANNGTYESSEMYTYVHNTVLPNLRNSGLNITSCDLVSMSVFYDISNKTKIANGGFGLYQGIWLTDPYSSWNSFNYIDGGGLYSHSTNPYDTHGLCPLITVVK